MTTESAESPLTRGDPVRVRPGRPHAGCSGCVHEVLDDGSLKSVVVILWGVEGSKYYAADELECPTRERDDSDRLIPPEQWARPIERHNNRPPCGTLPRGGVRIRMSEPDAEARDA